VVMKARVTSLFALCLRRRRRCLTSHVLSKPQPKPTNPRRRRVLRRWTAACYQNLAHPVLPLKAAQPRSPSSPIQQQPPPPPRPASTVALIKSPAPTASTTTTTTTVSRLRTLRHNKHSPLAMSMLTRLRWHMLKHTRVGRFLALGPTCYYKPWVRVNSARSSLGCTRNGAKRSPSN
jgi:hypothetical protein